MTASQADPQHDRGRSEAAEEQAGCDWRTSFEAGDPQPLESSAACAANAVAGGDASDPAPLVATVGGGPASGPNVPGGLGFSGPKALRYRGSGAAGATSALFDGLGLPIGHETELRYRIFPTLGGDLQYPATFAAIDLDLVDGRRVSGVPGIVDAHGGGIHAASQGASKILYADQWNSVTVALGSLAGATIERVLLTYDNPEGRETTRYEGWVDDIVIADAVSIDTSEGLVSHVDTRRGTDSSGSFSRGNNLPATAVPNGFNFWTPMTDASSETWLYEYAAANGPDNLPSLQGIGVSHEPSPWMGDRNQLAILPAVTPESGPPDATLSVRSLPFAHSDEVARPDVYSVRFANGMSAAVTPTNHGAVMRFAFARDRGSVIVDRVAGDAELAVAADGTLSGWVDGGSRLSVGASRMFVRGAFSRRPVSIGSTVGDRLAARFASFDGGTVELRLATSFISLAQASKNLELEVAGRSFESVRGDAVALWNERLGVIALTAATPDQLASVYGSLYRLGLYPNSQFENTGTASEPVYAHASPVAPLTGVATATTTDAQVMPGRVYVNNGFWDTYRTAWPAYSMLYPELAGELMGGFVQQYHDGGWIARWSSPGYADLMTGTSSDVAFADAYLKGVPTRDALAVYDAALKNATVLPTEGGVGRKGLSTSIFSGYTSSETDESVSWALEGYINDFGLSRMAARLAQDPTVPIGRRAQLAEEAAYFAEQSSRYVELFDPAIGFFQARNADGSFAETPADYDPESWGGAYTETDGWNFAFHAPHDVPGLATLYGGAAGLVEKLDLFFATPETGAKPGGYGQVIHEMIEARDVRLGQLGISNQPSHHIPYVYAAAGAPSKTQAVVREITRRLFVGSDIGQGYPGDEDNGEMSAWYLFSALGFYPLALASGTYTIGSPLFTRVVVTPLGGNPLTIEAPENSIGNVFVQAVRFDGEPLEEATLSASAVSCGGTLSFDMGPEASEWGAGAVAGSAVGASAPGSTAPGGAAARLVDVTRAGVGTTTVTSALDVAAATDVTALTDDDAMTEVVFADSDPEISFSSVGSAVTVTMYTLTNGAGGASPTAWTLEGSDDGASWTAVDERTAEGWPWRTQTRPFVVASPRASTRYRLSITATTDGTPPTLAELQLLAVL